MKPEDDGLIAHIRESLTEHEEAYNPGAWERFEKKERKGKGLLWLTSLAAAAVALMIGFALFYTSHKTLHKNPDLYTKISKPVQDTIAVLPVPAKETAAAHGIAERLNTGVAHNQAVTKQRSNNNISSSPLIVNTQQPVAPISAVSPVKEPAVQEPKTSTAPVAVTIEKKEVIVTAADSGVVAKTQEKTNKPLSFQEFLNAEVKTNPQVAQTKSVAKKSDKWEMGVVVAPSIGNGKKLNMGYGVSMAYALSNKVSISSGISYSEMGASKDLTNNGERAFNSPGPASAMVRETKSLQSVDANLVGLDIPIEIKYYFNKKFYTNVGLSAFAVLSQKQSNNYLQGVVENDLSNQSGFSAVYTTKSVSEAVPSAEVRNDKYLGFYNISFGYKQKISDKRAFAVEPFLKLPVKEFTKENLYLLGTGIRLKFDF
ncbi:MULTISPECIES: outer membrane beta-barrel protein [Pedobacter]|uniref:Outer membrane protein beta-barrel domain-containing protein n=1 Tax=Pedobacter heparinus (strain ATCC 13125 / DSM 2366 / CIP 104194 / JCM 7457 / NBRC 12017 / NCIMB 9290 / NRRL B-14731 / HIM 762-3) TaxID=485917 RepID=C6XXM7_PEDHD|nr:MULTISPECIES: outer membrane beta-barrel protein [Pedobacter]ACU02281.1 hypothetical protein Phep_0055 [Pedobacter heparinus DSM 2366]MBB5437096.1 hypothetical protein [Pedobacter sp. AK017]